MIDANAKTVREILNTGSDQYLIPFFQRHYSWSQREWDRLWEDVVELIQDDGQSKHFMGPLVCTPTSHMPGEVTPYQLIDGQQRLTTISIVLIAARTVAEAHGLTELSEEIYEDFLVHKRRKGLDRYRILPRFGDRETLVALIEQEDRPKARRDSIEKACRVFQKHIATLIENTDTDVEQILRSLLACLTDRLALVAITIQDENPYNIFESLNGKGLPLEQADLIRNFMFMQVPFEEQEKFNEKVWQPFEDELSPQEAEAALSPTKFYRNFLMRNGDYSPKRLTFVQFKEQAGKCNYAAHETVKDLRRFLAFQQQLLEPDRLSDMALARVLDHVRRLDATTAHPLLLHLLSKADQGELESDELVGCITDLCSFVLRRSICGESTRRYGQLFVAAVRSLQPPCRSSLQNYLLDQGWPDDQSVMRAARAFPIYRREKAKARLILDELERNHGHKEPVDPANLSIEHVMPQTIGGDEDGKAWQSMLGTQWEKLHREKMHTLGNLTLSGYNSKLSNWSYKKKRKLLLESHLQLNDVFQDVDTWDEDAILRRGETLSADLVKMWPRPAGGKEYVPSGGAIIDGREELFREYWDAFANTLAQSDCTLSVREIRSGDWVRLFTGRKSFWFSAELYLEEGELWFGMYTTGQNHSDYAKLVWNQLPDEISSELCRLPGVEPDWEESLIYGDDEISIFRSIEGIDDRSSWHDHHEWLTRAATIWERQLIPQIKQTRLRQLANLEDADLDVEDDSEMDEE